MQPFGAEACGQVPEDIAILRVLTEYSGYTEEQISKLEGTKE